MHLFSIVFRFELGTWLRTTAFYVYGLVFFGFAFITFIGTAGIFDSSSASTEVLRVLNAPYEIHFMLQYFNKFFLFLLPAVIGSTVYKDFRYRVHAITYSFPVRKGPYLLGKFLSAWLIVIFLTCLVGLAFLIGEWVPGIRAEMIGTTQILGYVNAYFIYVFPNMLSLGLIVFSVVLYSRNIYSGFMMVVVFFFLQLIVQNGLGGAGYLRLMAIVDPFGQSAFEYVTNGWSLEEQRVKLPPVTAIVVFNRLLWLAIGSCIFGVVYRRFSFSESSEMRRGYNQNQPETSDPKGLDHGLGTSYPEVSYSYSFAMHCKTLWHLSIVDFRYIIRSRYFALLVVFAILAVVFALARVSNLEDMRLLPVTRVMMTVPTFFFTMIIILLTFLFSGMVVHRSRMAGMDQLLDVTPIPNWVLLGAKVLALLKMQAILLLILMLSGILIQLMNGHYQLRLDLYLFHLYVVVWPMLIIWAFAAVFVQTLFRNAYLGLFLLLVGWLGIGSLPQAGIQTRLLQFNTPPMLTYSDLDGYGQQLKSYFLLESYWWSFGMLLLMLAGCLWFRGLPVGFGERLRLARRGLTFWPSLTFALLLLMTSVLGFSIYEAENAITNPWKDRSRTDYFAEFEKAYRNYETLPQPIITAIHLEVELFPENNSFNSKGNYTLVNRSTTKIDTLLLRTGFDEVSTFRIAVPHEMVRRDATMQFYVMKLKESLAPGDSTILEFKVTNKENQLFERNSNVLTNGTFLMSDAFPRIGYSFEREYLHPGDDLARTRNYVSSDAHLIRFETIVGTSGDQIAIAPGNLERSWSEQGRNYFHYKADQPIKFFWGYNSGRFSIAKDHWRDIKLEIYHHKDHDYNIGQMMKGLQSALDYNTKFFSPYGHRQIRIVEFPQSEGTFATTGVNNIMMSEARFILNSDTISEKIDLAFYIAAHELTHQWWGNQVIPGNAVGSRMITESITEYITLRVYENQYGPQHAHRFLRKQRQRYFEGRNHEPDAEPSLMFAKPEQQYLTYGKGAMAFHALSRLWGEEELNALLRDFLKQYPGAHPPYPTSIDLVEELRGSMPDSLQYLIADYFETVTTYDNGIKQVTISDSEKPGYLISIDLQIGKSGSRSTDINDLIEIGFYNHRDDLFKIARVRVHGKRQKINFHMDKAPAKIVLDPNLLLLDANLEDNTFVCHGS